MPKIPTFTSGREQMTTKATGVQTNIKLDPTKTMASALQPLADSVTDYAVKRRNVAEKIEAQRVILNLKAESDKIKFSQKDNINEEESINTFNQKFNPLLEKTISGISNRRVRKIIQDEMALETAENIHTLKKQSFEALEKESVRIYNDTQTSNAGKYKAATDDKIKEKYKSEMFRAAEIYNESHSLGSNDLKKRKNAISNALFITDAESLIGTEGGVEKIKQKDVGDTVLNNESFSKSLYSVYQAEIESITVKGSPDADFERAEDLLDELQKFSRSNGHKVVDPSREKAFATLKQKVLTEKIGHDDLKFQIEQGKEVADYSNAQKSALGGSFYNAMILDKSTPTAKALANEAKAEYDVRYDKWLSANSSASPFEKKQYAQELNLMLVDKYTDVNLPDLTTFNLEKNKFNVQRELSSITEDALAYAANPKDPNKLKSLAKLNGYVDKDNNPDVNAFLNVYIPILKEKQKGR